MFTEILTALRERLHELPHAAGERLNALLHPHKPAPPPAVNGHKPVARAAAKPTAETVDAVWPPARLAFVQRLWGEGFVEAGGAENAVLLAVPMTPSPQISFLDLSAGLGGAARVLHERFGVYVTGMEAHTGLARLGADLSRRKGMGAKATVEHYNPQTFAPPRRYDCILVRDSFFHQPHLGDVLARTVKALKPGGQLVLTDYVRIGAENPRASYLAWVDCERQPVHPWTAEQYAAAIKAMGLTVHVFEDATDNYRRMVLVGWANMLAGLHLADLGEGEAEAMVNEAELWLRRMNAFDNKSLRVVRLHARASSSH